MGQKGTGVSQGSFLGSLLVGNYLLQTTLFLSLGRSGCDCTLPAACLSDAVRCDCGCTSCNAIIITPTCQRWQQLVCHLTGRRGISLGSFRQVRTSSVAWWHSGVLWSWESHVSATLQCIYRALNKTSFPPLPLRCPRRNAKLSKSAISSERDW